MNTAQASVLRMPEPEAAVLIREGSALKEEIDEKSGRLREIHTRLAGLATFKDGKKTATVEGAGLRAKVQLKTYVKFDQEKVAFARTKMGDHAFSQVFGWTFKPRSQKDLDGFLAHGNPELVALVRDVMTITPGAPQVTYEPVEG
ncbi:MAG: hypothetical protein AB7D27_14815 [Desulfomicrobium sp.]